MVPVVFEPMSTHSGAFLDEEIIYFKSKFDNNMKLVSR